MKTRTEEVNVPGAEPSATEHTATPENTPVPGGGSWHWDYSTACWVSNDIEQPAQE